ncbi:protein FAR1-RELATED SEQUENCE 5-like [Silene latifolia]|uniref:protein FAR1-RELATED SEQUENCE 5-like n=1 Tax=Silene latifolia TaxID=37657 RepID=UPI003D76D84D
MLRCPQSGNFRMRKKSFVSSKRSYTGTIKCQCPFSLKCVKQEDGRWKVLVLNGYHNHNLARRTRALNASTKEDIVRMTASKIGVFNILIDLGNKGINVTAKQVYNVRAISKKKARHYRTRAEQLLTLATEHGYRVFRQTIPIVTQEGTHELTDVLFAHPDSLKFLKAYPYVLIADCMYKTNKYKMPLLEVIGVTPVHKNFSVFFAFLQNEQETAYDWAFKCLAKLLDSNKPIVFVTGRETALINAIETHFPSASLLLCRRHIEKDVEA